MSKFLSSVAAGGILLASSASVAFAAPPRADLQVQLQGPASVSISTPTTYTVSVKNLGPNTAVNTRFTVDFPLTNTSPSVHILGTVSGVDSRCVVASNKLTCTIGELRKGKTAAISYTYSAPVSTKTLTMKAVGTSDTTDPVAGNNESSFTPSLAYPSRPLTSATVDNSHCTGQNLTSYFECVLFPSSISSHETTLNADFTVGFSEPGYTGTWSQNAAKTTLRFEYFEATMSGSTKIAEFNGFATNVGGTCFDGMTTFFPATNYVSPYRVCAQ